MYTTSSLFLKTLSQAGITHAYVNWGSDHPALLEELARQRAVEGSVQVKIITCPNEMVALSAAQGYAQVTGKPAAVIVHVDVGTQALAGAVHNVDRSRTPVLIYAGASPFTDKGELKGSRNEWIMWMQDIPDQAAIVRQYMRFTSQIQSGKNISQVVRRALQISTSHPKGPVYLWARREVMEENVDDSLMKATENPKDWPSVEPSALSPTAVTHLVSALIGAHMPLIITSHVGRNPDTVSSLVALSNHLAIPVFATTPSAVAMPSSHPLYVGVSCLVPGTHTLLLDTADVIIVIDSDTPWIPANDAPREDARVFVLDSGDPLHEGMGFWHVQAEMVCNVDAEVALGQILEAVHATDKSSVSEIVQNRRKDISKQHDDWKSSLDASEDVFSTLSAPQAYYTVQNVLGALRKAIHASITPGARVLVLNESVSSYPLVWAHMHPEGRNGLDMITSGGSSLGWALAAGVGASLGGIETEKNYELVIVIVGDGSFLFGVPSSAYWMAQKYNTAFLTVVLNNGGWKSPKLSASAVYPNGHAISTPGHLLSVGFGPEVPDYAGIATASSGGWAWGAQASGGEKDELDSKFGEAIRAVVGEKRCAVLDCVLDSI